VQESVARGREVLNAGADPQMSHADSSATGAFSGRFSVVRENVKRLAQCQRCASRSEADPAAQPAYEQAKNTEQIDSKVVQPAKTATSDIFRSMQGSAPVDVSTFEGCASPFSIRTV